MVSMDADLQEQLTIEMESRCGLMRLHAQKVADTLRLALRVELMKIPKRIRGMSYEEFCSAGDIEQSDCSDKGIQDVLRDLSIGANTDAYMRKRSKSSDKTGKTTGKNKRRAKPGGRSDVEKNTKKTRTLPPRTRRVTRTMKKAMASKSCTSNSYVAATPGPGSRSRNTSKTKVPFTPASRAARYGEMLLSANGSPLGTVSKTKLKIGRIQATTQIQLELESGKVDFGQVNAVDKLTAGDKEEAVRKILDMQSHLASLMSQLQ